MSARATKLFNYDLAVKMWTFKPGYLGACILAVALLCGILGGSLLNVDSTTVTTTKYDYLTDITGLFNTSNEPQYIEYNPATNYSGYTASGPADSPTGVNYSVSTGSSNYRMLVTEGTTSAGPSGTVNNSSNYPIKTFNKPVHYYMRSDFVSQGNYIMMWGVDFKLTSMYDWVLSVWGDLSLYSSIEITPTQPGKTSPATEGGLMGRASHVNDNWEWVDISPINNIGVMTVDPESLTITATYNTSPDWTGYTHTFTGSLYDLYIYYGSGYQIEENSQGIQTSYPTTLSFSYTSNVTTVNQYNYLLPSDGVTLSNSDAITVWDNDTTATDYENQTVNILAGPKNVNGIWTMPSNPSPLVVSVNKNGGGTVDLRLSYDYVAGSYTWRIFSVLQGYKTIGDFPAVMLSLSNAGGDYTVKVYGVISWTNYLTVDLSPIASYDLAFTGVGVDLDNITFSNYNTTATNWLTWSVYSTIMFMNTYDTVLVNPSINLADYWPNMSSYSLAFQSFAIYGDSVTLNGVNYPITDGKITIGDKTYNFDNVRISYDLDGNTQLTFKNVNKTVDLGPTVNKVVAFSGIWYFSTGLYEGVASSEKVYNWDVSLFGDSFNTIILLTLGLVALFALGCTVIKGINLKLTDKIVLGAGALILVLFLVV